MGFNIKIFYMLLILVYLQIVIFDIIIIFIAQHQPVQSIMFTDQDLRTLKKVKNSYFEKKSEQQESSQICQRKSEDDRYISKYFLNNNFKILHIDIIGTQQVALSISRTDSYMIYIIRVMTEDYSYDIKRRYSEFLKLYQNIMSYEALRGKSQRIAQFQKVKSENNRKLQYLFPTKKISCSLRHFFNITNKQKLAEQRKSQLCSFLNQVKNNYYKFPGEYTDDYIQLLKFIDMKQQHQKYWIRKQGRILQISNAALRDSNLLNHVKPTQKQNQNANNLNINIDHLTQLLQHQMNKINLAVMVRQSNHIPSLRNSSVGIIDIRSDPMITDQIIKNVDSIKDIVIEMKRKINYDHIRCIIKGKDVKVSQTSSNVLSPTSRGQIKKGLIEVAVKFASNQLVSIHILKIILYVFLNSQCNYSSEAFLKILSQLDLSTFVLSQQKQMLALQNKQFRQIYFKIVKHYIQSREIYGSDRKIISQSFPLEKVMCLMLNKLYGKWDQHYEKNKQYKLKDQQKQWTMIIQNLPQAYNRKTSRFSSFGSLSEVRTEKFDTCPNLDHKNLNASTQLNQIKQQYFTRETKQANKQDIPQLKQYKSDKLIMKLKTAKEESVNVYTLKAQITDISYKQCVSIMKQQTKWNPLLLDSQYDLYSNTRKDRMQMPGKQEKMFRFVEQEQIQLNLQDSQEIEIQGFQHFVPVGHQDQQHQQNDYKDPKMSTQTMPSINGSCAHEHQPENLRKQSQVGLATSKQTQKINYKKSPPREGNFNSYHQSIKIERKKNQSHHNTNIQCCLVQINIQFSQATAMKYFCSEIQGTTQYIFKGFIKAFEESSATICQTNIQQ